MLESNERQRASLEQATAVRDFMRALNSNDIDGFHKMLSSESRGFIKGIHSPNNPIVEDQEGFRTSIETLFEAIKRKYAKEDYAISTHAEQSDLLHCIMITTLSDVQYLPGVEYKGILIPMVLETDLDKDKLALSWKIDLMQMI